ncbi:MAG: hypothetical protein KDA84_07725 [Planctomycetaceae bacterium]|nr:hypothetical protein [Planctomycetaceae bacterium]
MSATKSITMQVLDLSALRPGSVLPTPIYDAFNPALLLLGEGTLLNEQTLARLKRRGVTRVIIDSEHAKDIAPDSVSASKVGSSEPAKKITSDEIRKGGNKKLSDWFREPKPVPPTPEQAKRFVEMREMQEFELQETLSQVACGGFGKASKLKSLSVDSCEMMLEDLDLYVRLAIDRRDDGETYGHSLRTSQLAMAIAAVLGKSCDQISALGMGCLIARAGQTERARELTLTPRELSATEWLEVKKTPLRTYDLIEQCPDVPVGARTVAYQLFERWNGNGYPRGRSGTQINPLARIASVADAYVALTSGRPHRPPFSPYRAIEMILSDTRKGEFDPQAVRGLLQTVCLYPVGSLVRLSDNSQAVVMRTKSQAYDRPIVQIVQGPDGSSQDPVVVDLQDRQELSIVNVIESGETD